MNKVNPNDIAKWFCSQGIIENLNSEEGNMKLQKLLFFAQLIYMAKHNGETMFEEKFNAFKNGMVLEKIRKEYKNNYKKFVVNVNELTIEDEIVETLKLTENIFGDASAQELSELSHEFEVWKKYFKKSTTALGKYIKQLSVVPYDEIKEELYKIKKVLDAYEVTSKIDYDGVEDY